MRKVVLTGDLDEDTIRQLEESTCPEEAKEFDNEVNDDTTPS